MNYSRQRAEILHQLSHHRDHPTADVIYGELRRKDPTISLATVYRNLKVLADIGEIKKISFVSGADHFDPNVEPHYHFVCEKCGRVLDIPMQVVETLDQKVQAFVDGRIRGHELVFYGTCDECSRKADSD